jgi:hypothetical protein
MPAVRAPRRTPTAPPTDPTPATVPDPAAGPIPLSPDPGPRRARDLDGLEYLASLTPGEWDERIVYLYRQDPNIAKSDDRNKKYITKFSHAFDEEWVRAQFGGGRFLAIVKNQRTGSGDAERKFSFDIEGPPVLQPDEKFRNAPPAAPAAAAAAAPNFDPVALARTVGEVIMDARSGRDPDEDALARITQTMQQGSAAAIEVIKNAAMGRADSLSGNPMADKLIEAALTRMKDGGGSSSLKDTLQLIGMVKELGVLGGGQSPFTVLRELKENLGVDIPGLLKGGGGREDWRSALANNASSIFDGLATVLDKFAAMQRQNFEIALATHRQRVVDTRSAPPQAPAPADGASGAPASPPAVAPASALPPGFGSETPAPRPAPAAVPDSGDTQAFSLDGMRQLIFRHFQNGKAGDFVGALMREMWPAQLPLFQSFLGDPKALIEQAKDDPVLQAIAGDEEFPQFVVELAQELAGEESGQPPAA